MAFVYRFHLRIYSIGAYGIDMIVRPWARVDDEMIPLVCRGPVAKRMYSNKFLKRNIYGYDVLCHIPVQFESKKIEAWLSVVRCGRQRIHRESYLGPDK